MSDLFEGGDEDLKRAAALVGSGVKLDACSENAKLTAKMLSRVALTDERFLVRRSRCPVIEFNSPKACR